jgi:hypothetical protein
MKSLFAITQQLWRNSAVKPSGLAKRQTTDHLPDLVLCEGSLKLEEIL